MNDTAIKNYATWARRELIAQVRRRCVRYGILESGSPDAKAEVIDGRVLTAQERTQRAKLLQIAAADGWQELVERAAYTWFNRLLAIRFMEVNDRLPSHVRVLSAEDGSFRPQALSEAMDLPLDALDRDEAARLVQAGDDDALFRRIFLAQCDELAECMPAVFSHVGEAMELLLPDGLLRSGGVVEQLVTSIPEDDWREGVEIVGWMYQHYVSERKDEVFAGFKKGKKAERGSIAPATQLFTPNWIVRYLTENSLGRLWVLNHPDSSLPAEMPYFVKPDDDHEKEFRRISSPEEITVVDPACGSGHILVYAFELLSKMYAEAGYAPRDAARLIVEKNLSGMEIDPRAAAMASFAVTMKACELDSRFLRRGVAPRITVLERVELLSEELDLCPNMLGRRELVDAAAHLDECGSLLRPTEDDLSAIEGDLASLAGDGTVFASRAREKLERLHAELEPLARRYDVVVANPPYMGAKNMNSWLSAWIKDNYPNVKGDLFSCFMVRNSMYGTNGAQLGFMTPYVWMFISTYEPLRRFIIEKNTITSLIQLEYSGFAGATVPICTFTLQKGKLEGYRGGYIRLTDFVGVDQQSPKALEALANPDCGWFYQATATLFASIPGNAIVYWASENVCKAFETGTSIASIGQPRQGLATGKNDLFVRLWWEVSRSREWFDCPSVEASKSSGIRWFPYNKGGEYRKWYGNNDYVVNWENDGIEIKRFPGSVIRNPTCYFRNCITWSKISSGRLAFRYKPAGHVFDVAGTSIFASEDSLRYLLGACNSTVILEIAGMLSPTLNFEVGQISTYPILIEDSRRQEVESLVEEERSLSRNDWDAFETSWDFARHPLL